MWKRDASELVPPAGPKPTSAHQRAACIGSAIVIRGEVSGSEDLVIDGHVTGRVDLSGHNLTVGVGASVTADLVAKTVSISGTVIGNVRATERAEIGETGSVDGDITAPRIAIFDGATVHGHVDTTQSTTGVQENQHQLRLVAS